MRYDDDKAAKHAALVKAKVAGRNAEKDAEIEAKDAKKRAGKEAEKLARETKAHNNKMQILASKTVTALTGTQASMTAIMKSKFYKDTPPFLSEKIDSVSKTGWPHHKQV